ncbi:MAG TPA: hypothetical protein VFM77_13725 [Terriglobales bacterium]|nr:hypothetical protein [Terriglobales bacterium]
MTRIVRPILITFVLLVFAWAAPKGTAPRLAASDYPAHGQQDGVSVGAKLLTSTEVRKTFVSDLNHCCVVVELAVFPKAGQNLAVSLDDITLRVAGTDTAARPSSATVVSAALQKDAQGQRDVTVAPAVTVGYQTGTSYDPVTGTQQPGGVYTGVGVGVGVGHRGNQPGASEKDRSVMETELSEKGLPEGDAAKPVAGYLYFQIPKSKNAKYELQYKLNGNTVQINFK